MTNPLNPYYAHAAVVDPALFFGRQRELNTLYQALIQQQSVSIVGPRRIGKSSLLACLGQPTVQQNFPSDLRYKPITTFINLSDDRLKTCTNFFDFVSDQISRKCQPWLMPQPSAPTREDEFRHLLEDMKSNGFHPVLLLDNFDLVSNNPSFDGHFFSFLRSLAETHHLISYVTETKKPLAQVYHPTIAGSPFFNIFKTYRLGPLTPAEARELATAPAEKAGMPFTPEEVDWLLKIAGQHPFFLQVSCSLLFDEKRSRTSGRAIQYEKVQNTIYQALQLHFEEIWQTLSVEEQQELTTEVFQDEQARHLHQELSTSMLFRCKVREMVQSGKREKQKYHPSERRKDWFTFNSNKSAFYSTHQKSLQGSDTFPLLTKCLAGSYIEQAFEYLPWIERNCLLLYADAELTQADIAEVLGLDEQAVQKYLVSASRLWLQAYDSSVEKDLDISLGLTSGSSAQADLSRVKRLVQGRNH